MYNANVCYGANNYIDILYFLSNSVIHPHIDRLTFSCNSIIDKPEEILFSVLNDNGYACKYDRWIERGAYDRIKRYYSCVREIEVSILYKRMSTCRMYPCMRVIIDSPDIKTVDWFDAICNSLGFLTTLSHVELAIDFSPYEYGLQEFLWKHLFLRYNSGTVRFVGDDVFKSLYLGHKAKNSKSVIVYDRRVNDLNLLRLEFRLNRAFLKRYEIELDCFEKANSIDLMVKKS